MNSLNSLKDQLVNKMSIDAMIEYVVVNGYKKYRNLKVKSIICYANEVNFEVKSNSKTLEEDIDTLVMNYIVDKCGI